MMWAFKGSIALVFWTCLAFGHALNDGVQGTAQVVNILLLASLSSGGALVWEEDDTFASFLVLPYAIKHFNERDGTILKEFASLENCRARLALMGGSMHDDAGQPNVAMTILMAALDLGTVDVILGPGNPNVCFC
jgi:hypothetical protein